MSKIDMVVTLSPFKANMAFSDVLLPIAPFTETSGTFVNAEGRVQSFHAVVKPLGDTRPAWKVVRVLANLLDVADFEFDSTQDVLKRVFGTTPVEGVQPKISELSNTTTSNVDTTPAQVEPVVAPIYALDGIVRRAPSLQMTADAKNTELVKAVSA
jgi:NADH-quinone oxidoreductase subunit G